MSRKKIDRDAESRSYFVQSTLLVLLVWSLGHFGGWPLSATIAVQLASLTALILKREIDRRD